MSIYVMMNYYLYIYVEDVANNGPIVEDVNRGIHTNSIVATPIATVTSAAGRFTLLGGYNGNDGPNQGMAILTRKCFFQAFVITISKCIAMMSSQ